MNAGKYNKKISFCRHCDKGEENDLQKIEQDLVLVKKVWASVKATTASESYEVQRLTNTVTYDIRVRFSPILNDTNNIILYGGERLEIKSVVNVREEDRELAITAAKISKPGIAQRQTYFEI